MNSKKYTPPSIAIDVRVSPAEYQRLEEKAEAANLKPGRFAVAAALGLEIKPKVPRINRELYNSLAHTGNLLNQIARALNAGSIIGNARLVAALRDLQQQLAETRRALVGVNK